MPYQIIYSSVSSTPMQTEDLQDLLRRAQDNNARQGITGALVYVDGFFLQILEGPMESVSKLMEKIARDLRHETVTVLQAGEVAAAGFSDWTMAYVSATAEQVAEWAGLKAPLALPELFEQMRHDRQQAMRLANNIMSVLLGELAPGAKAPR
jgi:hypothetical protein